MITILTPTYNRVHTLQRLFDSLITQENMSFEWLVIDDGSTDTTKKLIDSFNEKKLIDIRYFYQENKGKPSAINLGIKKSSKDYIFIVDSDDVITNDCISVLSSEIKTHLANKNVFSGLCFRKGNLDGSELGKKITNTNLKYELYHSTDIKNLFKVDMAYCFKKKYMEKNIFPKFEDEKFVPELYIWNKITDTHLVYTYMNKVLYLCEYMPDGLSANFKSQLRKNPNGFLLYYRDQSKREKNTLNKTKMIIRVIQCYGYRALRLIK